MDWNQFLKEKIKADIKRLYLQQIYLLEDYLADDRISQAEFERARKRVLDSGNGCVRALESQLNEFEIRLKNNKE